MNERNKIIKGIRQTKLPEIELPDFPQFPVTEHSVASYAQSLSQNKGKVINRDELPDFLKQFPKDKIFSCVEDINAERELPANPRDFHDLKVVILPGQFGVVENGAVWLDDQVLPYRILPFIAEHLVVILNRKDLVGNMHDAYRKIENRSYGYGLFVAGPSKTADIEQSLVIGAHGARSFQVLFIN